MFCAMFLMFTNGLYFTFVKRMECKNRAEYTTAPHYKVALLPYSTFIFCAILANSSGVSCNLGLRKSTSDSLFIGIR